MMQFSMKINVAAGTATLLQMPDLAEGSNSVVSLAVSFDDSWDAFTTRNAILWREGEVVLRLPLDADGKTMIPSVFTLSEKPFLIRITGENAEQFIQTNELCAQFEEVRAPDEQDPQYTVYNGAYTLTKNKTYSVRNCLMAKDLTVAVPTVDTAEDTVTPQTLLEGTTAHDASGALITGSYKPPDIGFVHLAVSRVTLDGGTTIKEI